jgi:hypothetical protein
VKLSRESLLRFAADAAIALAWAGALWSLGDVETPVEWAVVAGATFLAGLLSGRYRILILAVGGVLLTTVFVMVANTCQPPSCEEELPLEIAIVFLAAFAAAPGAVMALGVFVRRRWRRFRERNGPWDWTSRSAPDS